MKKKILSFIIVLFITFTVPSTFIKQTSKATESIDAESKTYCTATIEDEFADDTVVIVLNWAATFAFMVP